MKTQDLRAKSVEVTVLPLPDYPEKLSKKGLIFTNLVGDNSISIQIPREKYLVNEAMEIKIIAEGEGALENFDTPKIFSHPDLELFDEQSSFEELGPGKARKTFNLTYLPRAAFSFPAKNWRYSVFNPESKSYVEKEISIPAIIVSGQGGRPSLGVGLRDAPKNTVSGEGDESARAAVRLLVPDFSGPNAKGLYTLRWINALLLLGMIFLLARGPFLKILRGKSDYQHLVREIKKNGPNYHLLSLLLGAASGKGGGGEGETLRELLSKLGISESSKVYLKELLDQCEERDFAAKEKIDKSFKFKRKAFDELLFLIKKNETNESSEGYQRARPLA